MEESPVQDQLTEIQNRSAKPRLKTVLFSLLGLALAGGLVFAGTQISKSSRLPLKSQNLTPTPILIASPTPDPTADWKTYTNEEYGYSVKYPTDNYVRQICPGGELILSLRQADVGDSIQSDTCDVGEDMVFAINTQKEIVEPPQSSQSRTVDSKEILVGGIKVRQYKIVDKMPPYTFTNFWAVLSNKGRNYKFTSPDESLFDQILSTFKFLE